MKGTNYWEEEYERLEDREFFRSFKSKHVKKRKESFVKEMNPEGKRITQRFPPKEQLIEDRLTQDR